jgi:hypothetical protein
MEVGRYLEELRVRVLAVGHVLVRQRAVAVGGLLVGFLGRHCGGRWGLDEEIERGTGLSDQGEGKGRKKGKKKR